MVDDAEEKAIVHAIFQVLGHGHMLRDKLIKQVCNRLNNEVPEERIISIVNKFVHQGTLDSCGVEGDNDVWFVKDYFQKKREPKKIEQQKNEPEKKMKKVVDFE